jgi:protein SCO1
MKTLASLSALFALLLVCMALSAESPPPATHPQPPRIAGFYLPQAMPLKAFQLTDHRGRSFNNEALRGRWTLLAFGYTHCPDVCPTTLLKLRETRDLLKTIDNPMSVAVVLVTLDPQRDGPATLARYVTQFDARFLGVSGSPADIDAFASQLQVKHARSGGTPSMYFIDHSSSVAVITPEGSLRALFSMPLRPETVSKNLQQIRAAEAPPSSRAASTATRRTQ